jgi:hypothetical protein
LIKVTLSFIPGAPGGGLAYDFNSFSHEIHEKHEKIFFIRRIALPVRRRGIHCRLLPWHGVALAKPAAYCRFTPQSPLKKALSIAFNPSE